MSETSGVCTIIPRGQKGFQPRVFGMGIVVSDREIVTCAHVINAALGRDLEASSPPTAKVSVCFPLAEGSPCAQGKVDKNHWFAPARTNDGSLSDIAVIQLDEDAPASVGRAMLQKHEIDQTVKAYGFRGKLVKEVWRSHPTGEWSDCKIIGPLPGGHVQLDGLRITGAVIEKGFSGAAVYWPTRDAVVGMIVESDKGEDKAIAQFMDVPSLWKALGRIPELGSPVVVRTTVRDALVLDLGRVPRPAAPDLFEGRSEIVEWLNRCLFERNATIVELVASGGVGKSMIAWKWLAQLRDVHHFRNCRQAIDWSFYSQGQHDYQTDSGKFMGHAARHFAKLDKMFSGAALQDWDRWEKLTDSERGELLANAFVRHGGIMILDGLEPLQEVQEQGGHLRDRGLVRLLQTLAWTPLNSDDPPRLLLITTRWAVGDLTEGGEKILRRAIDTLGPLDGARLLRGYRPEGDLNRRILYGSGHDEEESSPAADAAFQEVSTELGGHALALILLASCLVEYFGGRLADWRVALASDADDLAIDDPYRHARRVIRSYDRLISDSDTVAARTGRQVLFQLGLFDRPASTDLLRMLRTGTPIPFVADNIDETTFRLAIHYLHGLRLISGDSEHHDAVNAHPLLREHFGRTLAKDHPESWRAAHRRLFHSIVGPEQPTSVEEMENWFQKVVHGCKAGLHTDALRNVFVPVILHGEEAYAARELGAFSQVLSVLSHFFEPGGDWKPCEPNPRDSIQGLAPGDQMTVLKQAGDYLTPTKGYAAQQTARCYERGIEYSTRYQRDTDQFQFGSDLFEFQFGYWRVVLARGDIKSACRMAGQLVRLAQSHGAPEEFLVAHRAKTVSLVSLGNFVGTANHAADGWAWDQRSPTIRSASARRYLNEPAITSRVFGAIASWHLGRIREAREQADQAVSKARELDHPHTLTVALYIASFIDQFRRDPENCRVRASEMIELSDANHYSFWRFGGHILHGLALAQLALQPQQDERPDNIKQQHKRSIMSNGLTQLNAGYRGWRETGAELHIPFWNALKAELELSSGDLIAAEKSLESATISISNRLELWWSAEILRLQGRTKELRADAADALHRRHLLAEAEQKYVAALRRARQQKSCALQVRIVCDLAKLLRGLNRWVEAEPEIIRVLEHSFDEETDDLRELRRLTS